MTEPATGTDDAALSYRQGDWLRDLRAITAIGASGPREIETPDGCILLSQTCDLVRATPTTVQVAKLVRLSGPAASEARSGRRPQFVAVPQVGPDAFADLDWIATLDKPLINGLSRVAGVQGYEEELAFGRAAGRRSSRFAFPDEVQEWLRPLERIILERARRSESPIGRVLGDVLEFRVRSQGDWNKSPYSLTLILVIAQGVLPLAAADADDFGEISDGLNVWLYDAQSGALGRGLSEIAERMLRPDNSDEDRRTLWDAFAEACALECMSKGRPSDGIIEGAPAIEAEALGEDELAYSIVRRSVLLDLDHLSPPTPR